MISVPAEMYFCVTIIIILSHHLAIISCLNTAAMKTSFINGEVCITPMQMGQLDLNLVNKL